VTRPAGDTPGARPGRLRQLLVAGAVVLVVLLGLGGWALAAGGNDQDDRAAATTSAAPSAGDPAATSTAAGNTARNMPSPADATSTDAAPDAAAITTEVAADELPPSLPEVALDAPVDYGDGVSARITGIDTVQGEAKGPGEVAGPALAVTVALTNGGTAPVSLYAVTVNLTYGAEFVPATLLAESSPLSGALQPAGTVTGTYVFTVPEDQRDDVAVTVGHDPASPIATFRGAVR